MKTKYLLNLAAWVALTTGVAIADDSMKSTVPLKKQAAAIKTASNDGPVDRELEVRLGPRATFLSGNVKQGKGNTGDEVDIFDTLNLDGVNPGVQFDVDWQPISNFHTTFGLTYDSYDQSGTTSRNITTTKGDTILAGSTVKASGDIYTFEGKVGYDVYKSNTYRVQPYVGGKGVLIANAHIDGSGSAIASPNGNTRSGTRVHNHKDVAYGTFLGGVDQRVYISRDWYTGIDVGGFGLDRWGYITGDAYMGYDFTKNFGLRAGYDANYLMYENSNKSTKTDPLLGAAYVQAVWGF